MSASTAADMTIRILGTLAGAGVLALMWWECRRSMTPARWALLAAIAGALTFNTWFA